MNRQQLFRRLLEESSFLAFTPADLSKIEQRYRSKKYVYARFGYQWKHKRGNSRKGLASALRASLKTIFDEVAKKERNSNYQLNFATLRGEAGTYLLRRIMLDIISADILIFDVTFLNPNVFFELGIAYATDRRVFLLVRGDKKKSVPSDLQGLTISVYKDENDFSLDASTRTDLRRLIRAVIKKKSKLKPKRS